MKVYLHKVTISFLPIFLVLVTLLTGCSSDDELRNSYVPAVNEDGYIVMTMPISLMGGQTADQIIEDYHNDAIYESSGAAPMTERITEVTKNEDGTVNYIFTPEQFSKYKQDLYEIGRLRLVYGGNFPASIEEADYTDIDENGVPWTVIVLINQEAFKENYMESMVFSTVWPATYLGKYQIFCGIPEDEWAVHIILKDVESGDILTEMDYTADSLE